VTMHRATRADFMVIVLAICKREAA
jgi:hypothetical protein